MAADPIKIRTRLQQVVYPARLGTPAPRGRLKAGQALRSNRRYGEGALCPAAVGRFAAGRMQGTAAQTLRAVAGLFCRYSMTRASDSCCGTSGRRAMMLPPQVMRHAEQHMHGKVKRRGNVFYYRLPALMSSRHAITSSLATGSGFGSRCPRSVMTTSAASETSDLRLSLSNPSFSVISLKRP